MTNDKTASRSSLREAAIASLKSAIAKLREYREIDNLGEAELERLARDMGLSPSELRASAWSNSDWVQLLEKRLQQFEFEKSSLETTHPRVVHDLEQTCARCGSASRCSSDFSRPDTKAAISDYCPNTYTLEALETERDRAKQST